MSGASAALTPMTSLLDHGRRLTGAEFDRRVAQLHAALPPAPTRDQLRALRRAELDLAIDHRLGERFPTERRDALWRIHERLEKKRGRLVLWHLVKHFVPGALDRRARGLAGYLFDEYRRVLTQPELSAFLGVETLMEREKERLP